MVAFNRKQKDALKREGSAAHVAALEFIEKLIKLRESGQMDELLQSTDRSSLDVLLSDDALLKLIPRVKSLQDCSDNDIREFMLDERYNYVNDAHFSSHFDAITKHLKDMRRDPAHNKLCWVRPSLFVDDFLRGKRYGVTKGYWNVKNPFFNEGEFFKSLVRESTQHQKVLVHCSDITPQYKLITGAPGKVTKRCPSPYQICDNQRDRMIRLIFVYTKHMDVIVSGESFSPNSAFARLAHSQLVHGYPVRAAGELVLECRAGNWYFVEINNRSGHYAPPATVSLFGEVETILRKRLHSFFLPGLHVRKINTLALGMPGISK